MSLNKIGIMQSNGGSVRFLDGQFYHGWDIVYVPLTNADMRLFLQKVTNGEKSLGRRLTRAEIEEITKEME